MSRKTARRATQSQNASEAETASGSSPNGVAPSSDNPPGTAAPGPPAPGPPAPEWEGPPSADILRDAARAAQIHAVRPVADHEEPAPAEEEAETGDEPLAALEVRASATERLASTDFAELSPAELLMLSGLMRKLTLAVPLRRSRRPNRTGPVRSRAARRRRTSCGTRPGLPRSMPYG